MVFDVTKLDKTRLIQSLYIHADPTGYGKMEYAFNDLIGKNVLGLTHEECRDILSMDGPHLSGYLVDYYNGKPLKLDFEHVSTGRILVSSVAYDMSNGRYRFLEALLYVFNLDEIVITEKDYPHQLEELLNEGTMIHDEEVALLENIIEHTFMYIDCNGMSWKIDTGAVDYKPPFMRGI